MSYAGIFAERNKKILIDLLLNYYNRNTYICYYLLRDMIENIKLYLGLIKGPYTEIEVVNEDKRTIKEEKNMEKAKKIISNLIDGQNEWDFNFKEILKKNASLNIWSEEFKAIKKINDRCNSYIHKNGFEKIIPNLNKYEFSLNDVYYVIKFFFTLIVSLDGKSLSAPNYMFDLYMGIELAYNSQYEITQFYATFINEEYTIEKIKKLKSLSYMNI